MKILIILFTLFVFFSCENEKNKSVNFVESQFLQPIPNINYSPSNPNWVIEIDNRKFQIIEIEKYKHDSSLDSFFVIKSDFVLGYSFDDLKKDSLLSKLSGSNSKRSPQISGNKLIDKNDTFFIKKLDDTTCFVQSLDSMKYRFYKITLNR